jgi:FdhD protein
MQTSGAATVTPGGVSALVLREAARQLLPALDGSRISNASRELLREISVIDEYGDEHSMQVPVEQPLTVFLDGREIVTLWTLGACPEWLVLGYLHNRQLIGDVTTLECVEVDWDGGRAVVTSRQGPQAAAPPYSRLPTTRISRATVLSVLASVRGNDAIYRSAGSVHHCALFHGPDLWMSVEDTSRRNGVDIVSGWMALHRVTGCGKILYSSGRLTAEIVMKAAQSGISVVISRKGMTAVCCEIAAKLGMTLLGHAANHRYVCYAGADHFDRDA